MLGYLVPDLLQRAMEQITLMVSPLGWHRTIFASLILVYLLGLAKVLQFGIAHVDLAWADTYRRVGQPPARRVYALGEIARRLSGVALAVGGLLVLAELGRTILRFSLFQGFAGRESTLAFFATVSRVLW